MKATDQRKENLLTNLVQNYQPRKALVLDEIQDLLVSGNAINGKTIEKLTHAEAQDNVIAKYRKLVTETQNLKTETPYLDAHKAFKEELVNKLKAYSTEEPQSWLEKAEIEIAKQFATRPQTLMGE